MEPLTKKELRALYFWARVGVETNVDGQYASEARRLLCQYYHEPVSFGSRYFKDIRVLQTKEFCKTLVVDAMKLSWHYIQRDKIEPLEQLYSDFPKTTITVQSES